MTDEPIDYNRLLKLILDLREPSPDISLCRIASDELVEMLAEIERLNRHIDAFASATRLRLKMNQEMRKRKKR
jgi:hypothetical protein